jgi:hypothetical protein
LASNALNFFWRHLTHNIVYELHTLGGVRRTTWANGSSRLEVVRIRVQTQGLPEGFEFVVAKKGNLLFHNWVQFLGSWAAFLFVRTAH